MLSDGACDWMPTILVILDGKSSTRESMSKAHDVSELALSGCRLHFVVDGRSQDVDLAPHSSRLAQATQAQRNHVEITPSGYGLHWPELDEELSIDGLIGTKHSPPLVHAHA